MIVAWTTDSLPFPTLGFIKLLFFVPTVHKLQTYFVNPKIQMTFSVCTF